MTEHDALLYLIHSLRAQSGSRRPRYGYDVYIPDAIRAYLREQHPQLQDSDYERLCDSEAPKVSPEFYGAAWNLCRRGILRPGVRRLGDQATADGSGGNGYSITPFGAQWLTESERDDFVPTEPERFGQMLSVFRQPLGSGFHERGQEAVRCYGAHAYLACCAMCGAAAESVLLAVAIAKEPEVDVLKMYASANGRSRVEQVVVGQAVQQLRREFLGFTSLLKYWRDEAAHGKASGIGDNEAYTSLALLLRLAQFTKDHWTDLTYRGA